MNATRGLILLACIVAVLAASTVMLWLALKSTREGTRAMKESYEDREENYLQVRRAFEGKLIADAVGLNIDDLPLPSRASPTLVVLMRTLECPTCFEFHADQIQRLHARHRLQVLAIGSGPYETLLRRSFPFGIALNERDLSNHAGVTSDPFKGSDFSIFFLNESGRILWIDLPDQTDYSKSEAFYSIVGSYLASSNPSR